MRHGGDSNTQSGRGGSGSDYGRRSQQHDAERAYCDGAKRQEVGKARRGEKRKRKAKKNYGENEEEAKKLERLGGEERAESEGEHYLGR